MIEYFGETGTMLTMDEAIKRLEHIEKEIDYLKQALQAHQQTPVQDGTSRFLKKCGGWEDTRTPDEIISEIYSSRTTSLKTGDIFDEDEA